MAYLKHFVATLAFFFVLFNYSFAQEKARVLNLMTGFPIELVEVHTADLQRASVTDKDGFFDLKPFLPQDTLYFRHAAFTTFALSKGELSDKSFLVFLTPQVFLLNEFVVTAPSIRQNTEDLPNKVNFIDAKQVSASTFLNGADILSSTGNVVIQKTQGGGGSPILRGFEANKVLLVVDGIRMNNAIYRSGHLQNAITVDPAVLEQVDVIFGPTSIAYGSDALGGVIHYKTKSPKLGSGDATILSGGGYSQYSTATSSFKQHINLNVGTERFGSFTAATFSKYGETTAGKWRNSNVEDNYALVQHYAERQGNQDIMVVNKTPEEQKPTGFSQVDFLQKFKYVVSPTLDLETNFQYSTSTDVDRLDKLMGYSDGELKYAENGYGPQGRLLGAVSAWYKKPTKWFTNVKTIVAYQRIDEDRFSRKFNKDKKLWQREDLNIFSWNTDFVKIINEVNKLNYGLEVTHNQATSEAEYIDITTNISTAAQTRYPDGGSKTWNYAAFATYKWLIQPGYVLNAGVRYSYSLLHSDFTKDYQVDLPVKEVNIRDGAPTANLGMVISPSNRWRLNLIASSGFRTPNIDDYGKVRAKSGDVTVPNDELKSEFAYNLEATFEFNLTDELSISTTAFQTWVKDAIVRQPYSINGANSLFYDGEEYRIVTNLNAEEAVVKGISATLAGKWEWGEFSTLKLRSTINYTHGENITNNEPLGHIPPIFGRTSLYFADDKWTFGISSFYNGDKWIEDMSPYGEDNDDFSSEQYGGYPSWWTLNASGSYRVADFLRVQLAIDNIFDAHYRPFASPVAAPGRNFVGSLYFEF